MEHTRLYNIRHGQVVGFETPAYNGSTDVDLTDLGRAQLDAAAEDLKDAEIDVVISSDLQRAIYGGRKLAEMHGLELNIEPAFREIHFGVWEGIPFEEVERRWPGELDKRFKDMANHRIPEAETIGDVWARVNAGMDDLLEKYRGKNVALVAHSGVNRAILLQTLDCGPDYIWRIDQDYGCLNIIDYFHDNRCIIRQANGPNRATVEAGIKKVDIYPKK